jgi:hypothetical protein
MLSTLHTLRLDLGRVLLSEYDADGFIGIGLDGYGEEQSGLGTLEAHHPFGFAGRPLDPDSEEGLGATVLRFDDDNGAFVMALGDPRITKLLPQMAKGSSIQYGGTAAALAYALVDGADGSWTVHVPSGAAKARIEHAGGVSIEITPAEVQLGGVATAAVVIETGALAAFFSAVATALSALGQPVTPPAGFTATKVKAL